MGELGSPFYTPSLSAATEISGVPRESSPLGCPAPFRASVLKKRVPAGAELALVSDIAIENPI
jgi:hypothetical protein